MMTVADTPCPDCGQYECACDGHGTVADSTDQMAHRILQFQSDAWDQGFAAAVEHITASLQQIWRTPDGELIDSVVPINPYRPQAR